VTGDSRSSPFTRALSQVTLRFGLTRAVVNSVLARVWSVVAGPISLVCVARFLSREEQGFYYTFWSVLGLQIVFELGFSFVIAQFASHERANLRYVDGKMTGDVRSHQRLASLLRLSVKWYCAAGLFMIVVLLPAGVVFFARYARGAGVQWTAPWILVAVLTAFNLMLIPFAALLEGAGQIEDVSLMRLLQLVTTNVMVWICLAAGARLYSAVALSATMALFATCWMAIRHRALFLDLWHASTDAHPIDWRAEVWPFQWRMAVSWVSGYIIFQLFNPILFAARGAVEAAQMGMSLMVVISISTFATAWINARAVDYGALIARRRFEELDAIFRASLWQSVGAMSLLSAGFLAAVVFLRSLHHSFADRLLAPFPLVLLIAGTVLNHVFVAEAAYLRAFKREPFMWVTLVLATLSVGGSLLVARRYGATGVAVVFFAVMAVVAAGGGTAIFMRSRRSWRGGPIDPVMEPLTPDTRGVDSPAG
jgi:hypothetical protein